MAFSIRKMLSNMNYFKKPDEDGDGQTDTSGKKRRHSSTKSGESISVFDKIEPDSTSKTCATTSDVLTVNCAKTGSLSDTDLITKVEKTKKLRRRNKKLKLDIEKANKSMSEALDIVTDQENINVENTPKHISLGCRSSEAFAERIKEFDFSKSFDIFDAMAEDLPEFEDRYDIESLSDQSESDVSIDTTSEEKNEVQMCRKVETYGSQLSVNDLALRSTTPESFGDVELEKTEDDRITLLLSYQMRLEKMERFLKKMLTEFQFHIEVSKVFHSKSVVTTLPGSDVSKLPKILGEITHIDNISRGVSPTGSWNIVLEKEDTLTKFKLRKQLLSMKHFIEEFVSANLQNGEPEHQDSTPDVISKTRNFLEQRSITFDLHKGAVQKRMRVSGKKKFKRCNDFPDLKDAMENLFALDSEKEDLDSTITSIREDDKCTCHCQRHSSITQTDSGLIVKTEDRNTTITSSIGNFSLDTSTLTAYSDTLDQIISYNSFQDTSLYNTLLQKAAIERITFYVQVHSIQIKCEADPNDFESKTVVSFYCPSCKHSESDEQGVIKHILEQTHCEKIHFLYKTAYIKKCLAAGKEIQPSTVLNPMTMYRDDNKIVCFGDAAYACSLCFEMMIVGESVLMAHCAEEEHVERRERLADIIE